MLGCYEVKYQTTQYLLPKSSLGRKAVRATKDKTSSRTVTLFVFNQKGE
jgi:hypothetical protein